MPFGTSYTIPEHTRHQFQDAFLAQIQQADSKFSSSTNVDTAWTAEKYTKRMSDTQEWLVNNARFQKLAAKEFKAGFRTGFKQHLSLLPTKFDRKDGKLLDTIALPTGDVIQNAMKGLNRLRDDLFIDAANAQSLGGEHPHVTPTAFPTANVVPVNYVKPGASLGSNTGLTYWKIRNAKTLLEKAYVDFDSEEMILAISPDDKTHLLLQAEAATNEPWAKVVMEWDAKYDGGDKMAKLAGFQVITTNRLNVSSSITTCLAFAKRAFCWAPLSGVETHIDILPTEGHAIQVSGYADFGVFRVFDEMVYELPCYNA